MLTGIIALLVYPFASRTLAGPLRPAGRLALLMMRSTPELMIAFVLLLLFGPSGLPAVLALAIHNGGLIGFLLANASEQQAQRPDDPRGIGGYLYLHTPRLYPAFLAFLFYRWEVILRESAIMGVLGIATLGFFVDSAFEEIRYDKALFFNCGGGAAEHCAGFAGAAVTALGRGRKNRRFVLNNRPML